MPRPSRTPAATWRLIPLLIFVVLLGWFVTSTSASIGCYLPAFKTVQTFSVASNQMSAPSFIVSGDFNSDGKLDVITATDGSNNTWLRLGQGGGTFGPSTSIASSATYITTADFNSDGKLDLALVLDTGSNTGVTIYLGSGAGGFTLSTTLTVGSQPQTVVTADFNADGKIDLATVNFASNELAVALGDGTGHFATPVHYPAGAQPRGLAVGDFNNDGQPDLVTTSTFNEGAIQVYLNMGGGNFAGDPINTSRPGTALYISVADFNSDGNADVALSLNNGNSISVRLGNGAGGFNGFTGSNDYPILAQPANLNIGDFNSDGKLDIATADRTSPSAVSLLIGDGAGNFSPTKNFAAGIASPWSTAAGDFNSDGKLDLVVASRTTNSFGLLLGDGAGNFPQVVVPYPVGSNPLAVATGDFNSDGKVDLVTANQLSNNLSVLPGDGLGNFGTAITLAGSLLNSPRALVVADFNNDGKTDIAVANGGNSVVTVLLNNGTPGLVAFTQAANSPYLVAGDPRSIAVGDLNGDNKPDIVTGAYNGDRISVLFNLGAGGFGNYAEYQLSATVYLRVTGVVIGDFNQDNLLDVAAVSFASNDNRLTLFFNQGGGVLGNRTHFALSSFTGGDDILAADFNRDGKLDILAGSQVFLATGGGSFAAPTFTNLIFYNSLAMADINGDGKLDLIATINLNGSEKVLISTGNGLGSFNTASASYITGPAPYGLAIADLNDDTKPDIAVTDINSNSVSRLINVCNKTPGDFDDDGRTDISVWNPNSGNWYIFNSRDNSFRTQIDWGRQSLGDIPVPGDYDGDAKTDIAIFRPSEGNWYIINSDFPSIRVQNWGGPGDRPAPADFDGDGKMDFAIFRPSEGNWYVLQSATGTIRVQGWGVSTDKLVPGDYDGDGKADFSVWRPSEGNWYIRRSGLGGGVIQQQWGVAGDIPVPGDYDGDSKTDIAVFRPSDGNWYIIQSSTNTPTLRNWGNSDDVPIPGDYDRDGKTDIAVYRPSDGNWYIIQSSTNTAYIRTLGVGDEVPVPSTYIPYS